MNYLQLVNRVKRESPHTGGDLASLASAVGQTAKMVGWVQDAWNEIQNMCSQFNWKWMRARALGDVTVVGGMAYTIDQLLGVAAGTTRFRRWQPETDEYRITAYLDAQPQNEWHLRFLDYETFDMRFLRGQHAAGPPQFWSTSPTNQLLVGPTPDQSYKVRADYWKSNQILTADTDIPEMPVDFHMMIVWKALNDSGAFDAASETVARSYGHYERIESDLIADQRQTMTITARPLGG